MNKNQVNKSDFVRSMGDKPAKEIVATAKKKGFKLTERYVYVIRSADKAKRRGHVATKVGGRAEADMRRAVAELGLARSRQVLADVERAFGAS